MQSSRKQRKCETLTCIKLVTQVTLHASYFVLCVAFRSRRWTPWLGPGVYATNSTSALRASLRDCRSQHVTTCPFIKHMGCHMGPIRTGETAPETSGFGSPIGTSDARSRVSANRHLPADPTVCGAKGESLARRKRAKAFAPVRRKWAVWANGRMKLTLPKP